MVVVSLFAVQVLMLFFAVAACWAAISLQGKLNQAIEGVLRVEAELRQMQKPQA